MRQFKALLSRNLLCRISTGGGRWLNGRYKLTQVLAENEFGRTYLAIDTHRPGNPQCIIKQLQPLNKDPKILPEIHRLFNVEARILEELGKNDQISQILAYFEEGGAFHLVQDYIPGHSLSQEILPGQPLPPGHVVELLQDILGILEVVHSQQVIHRDIKPENLIRRDADGKLVLIDFGAIKELKVTTGIAELQANLSIVIGTRAYMSLEQLAGNPQLNSDLYAVGIIGLQSATGLTADQLQSLFNATASEAGAVHWRDRVHILPPLAAILEQMVHSDYRQRYQSAADILADLDGLEDALQMSETASNFDK